MNTNTNVPVHDPTATTYAQRIDAFIYHAGFSKRKIAQVAQMRPSSISAICLGKANPTLSTLSRLAAALSELTRVETTVLDLLQPRLPRPPFRHRSRPNIKPPTP